MEGEREKRAGERGRSKSKIEESEGGNCLRGEWEMCEGVEEGLDEVQRGCAGGASLLVEFLFFSRKTALEVVGEQGE